MTSTASRGRGSIVALIALATALLPASAPATATGCMFEPQGEGRVAAIIDVRTFRLEDGREVRLAGIEPATENTAQGAAALTAILAGRDVTLRGEVDAPDRYGRQPAFVFLAGSEIPVQGQLLARGAAFFSANVAASECAAVLASAEAEARQAKNGIWTDPSAIKNSESSGDILSEVGRFTVVEGRVMSVRQAGATTYLNFGRNWTRDFAVTISRRMIASFEAAGTPLKSFENKRIRVRGWVEARGGPRIEVLRVGQIETIGEN